ncbi:hypothetical protein AAMO2058_000598900 [Amorphochlora amoebiformis]
MSKRRDAKERSDDPEKHFEITGERLGKGAYGVVLKAKSKKTGKFAALKIMDIEKDDYEDLQLELKILAECDSPYLTAYYASFVFDNHFWIAMEYCGGGSVMDLMEVCQLTLNHKEIAVCAKHALLGLDYLHKHKIIHRDVKAANLLLTEKGDCKLADFGVSKRLHNTLAKTKTMIGTPYWMAPEVVDSKKRTHSGYNYTADIWSLGITMIECADGRPPLAHVYPMRAIFLIPSRPPPTLKSPKMWPKEMVGFLQKCLVKDYKSRPTAAQMLKHPFVAGAPDKKVLADLVKRCMNDIQLVRESRQSDDDEDEDEDEGSDSDSATSGSRIQTGNYDTVRSGLTGATADTEELRESELDHKFKQVQDRMADARIDEDGRKGASPNVRSI